jgi:hypothetical protein
MRRISLVLALSALSFAACGHADPGAPDASGVDATGAPDGSNRPDGMQTDQSRVYGHSQHDLYRIDTGNLNPVLIGSFGAALGAQSMTDIAINKDGEMYGVSLSKIFSIDPDTAEATELAAFDGGSNLTSLSFVPLDDTDPTSAERLVTAGDAGDVFEINITTDPGATTLLGNFGTYLGEQIVSSGDIVSVRGFGTLVTVDATADFADPDFLATVNTDTWVATPIGTTSTGFDRIFGLGFWGGTIFGFVDNGGTANTGNLITIDPDTGVGTAATNQSFRWYGAGVTTIAPIVN